LRRFDSDPVMFRLLDAESGGFWDLTFDELRDVSRAYMPSTNVLQTTFKTGSGVVRVTDFMPVGRSRGASVHDYVSLNAPGWLVRRFECLEGGVHFLTRFLPRGSNFSTDPLPLRREGERVVCPGGLSLWCEGEPEISDNGARIRIDLVEGETRTAVLTSIEPLRDPRDLSERLLNVTLAFWREWSEYSRYRGPYEAAVQRSALALKLLTYAPTGALVAAPTTSLPEQIGGERNWDYRFCWLRDATLAFMR
jgi:GH15 family glucan-1,4-alpha-glucosidase